MTVANNPVESLAKAVYSALENDKILRDIKRNWRGKDNVSRPGITEVTIWHFHQIWGSTALGFGGMGGAAMSGAYTTVIKSDIEGDGKDVEYAVFFAGRHAYTIENPDERFFSDLKANNIAAVSNNEKYVSKT